MSRKKQQRSNWCTMPPGQTITEPTRPDSEYVAVSKLLAKASQAQRQQAMHNLKQARPDLHSMMLAMGRAFGRMELSVDKTTAGQMLDNTGIAL